ncbi:hypothetical protein [Facklamia lactis]|uniref:hypothetical protein n=1 Tax=Facklamia lactis TaxID=2749967 RepID=UPI001C551069|nr:hypothetical protein [Facklamia lactis]
MKSQHPNQLKASNDVIQAVQHLYRDHEEFPYISPDRNIEKWLEGVQLSTEKIVPKRNMIRTKEGLLPGHIILLWRVSHGNYTVGHSITKYFEYDYGIDGHDIDWLVEEGYVRILTPKESLIYVTSPILKQFLKETNIKGFSKMKKEELIEAVREIYTEEELELKFDQRGYILTSKGEEALKNNQAIIDKHPKKAGY